MISQNLIWQHTALVISTAMIINAALLAVLFSIGHIVFIHSRKNSSKFMWKPFILDASCGAGIGIILTLIPVSVICVIHSITPRLS